MMCSSAPEGRMACRLFDGALGAMYVPSLWDGPQPGSEVEASS